MGLTEVMILAFGFSAPLIALVSVLMSDFKTKTDKITWLLVVILVPVIGAILYFLIGINTRKPEEEKENPSQNP